MAKFLIILSFSLMAFRQGYAQQLDSIYFNLYTDSLKKGTYNYINVDGRYTDGHYLPMSAREIDFSASAGRFEGNSLFIDSSFKGEKITVKAVVRGHADLAREITIYIKKFESTEPLPTLDEILNGPSADPGGRKAKRNRRRG